MPKSNNNVLWTVFKVYLAIDAVWAAVVATFASVVASQGLSLAGTGGVAATTGGVGAWILAFIGAAFQGGIFLFVYSVFGLILLVGATALTKDDPRARAFLSKYALVCLGLDVLWGVLVGTFGASMLSYVGLNVGAAATATTLGSVLLWIIAFVAGLFSGAVFLTVFTIFCVVILFIYALSKK